MKFRLPAVAVLSLAAMAAPAAHAQSIGDAMAYVALITTPTGGLPTAPLMGADALRQDTWGIRLGHISGSPDNTHIAGSLTWANSTGQFTLHLGTTFCDGCNGTVMLGGDWLFGLNSDDELQLGLRPALGIAKSTDDGSATIWSGAVSLPISWVASGQSTKVVPFIEPGFGFGGLHASGASESGSRFMTQFGVGIMPSDRNTMWVLSARKVFINNGDLVYNLGLTVKR